MNIGLRDQRAGLQCTVHPFPYLPNGLLILTLQSQGIHDNIEKFGGDPNRITSFGQSAGGTDTAFQIVAFGGKEEIPFQRAMYARKHCTLPSGNPAKMMKQYGIRDNRLEPQYEYRCKSKSHRRSCRPTQLHCKR